MAKSKYCNQCKMFFGEVAVHYKSLTCPVSTCKNRLSKIDDNMIYIIKTLNKNNYPVSDASLENNSIFIKFSAECRFDSLPKGFDIKYIDGGTDEAAVLITYSEPNINKTSAELNLIADDIFEWIKTFCNLEL